MIGLDTDMLLEEGDQVTTIINGDVGGNVVVVQANTTVDVTNVVLSLTDGDIAEITDLIARETGLTRPNSLLYLPVVSR
ncbi:MAG: hypothetical protein R2911_40045 [Caldilineaceae bacterium]